MKKKKGRRKSGRRLEPTTAELLENATGPTCAGATIEGLICYFNLAKGNYREDTGKKTGTPV